MWPAKLGRHAVFVLQHVAAVSSFPKRKQAVELLLRKNANVNEKNEE